MDFIFDPSLVLYLPLYELDGASFRSRDAYGHLCTVTGALWRPHGRYFDGTDDKITIPNATCLQITGDLTIIMWVKSSLAARHIPWSKRYVREGEISIDTDGTLFFLHGDGTNYDNMNAITTAGDITADEWFHLGLTRMHSALKVWGYVNGIDTKGGQSYTKTIASGTEDLLLGQRTGDGSVLAGNIGECLVYNRCLTPQEIQHNYLATKWRYR